MKRRRIVVPLVAALIAAGGHAVRADIKTEEKTRIQLAGLLGGVVNFFGGKAAREGVTSTVALKGDRKATTSDNTGRIIDLAEEKIYELDLRKKTYKVMTFDELRRQMEEAKRKAEEEYRKAQSQAKDKEKAPEPDPNAKELAIDFDVKETGQKKALLGYDAHEVVMTIGVHEKEKTLETAGGLLLTSDMWLASMPIPGLKDIRDFDIRFAQKLAGPVITGASPEEMGRMLAAYPMMKDAMARMSAEGAKLSGTPLSTVMTVDAVKSQEQIAQEAKQSEEDKSKDSVRDVSSIGGLLGGLAKRTAQRKADSGGTENKGRATIMTSTTDVLKVSPDVTAADVAVPANFKESR